MRKPLVSAVLLAALTLAGCASAPPRAATSAPAATVAADDNLNAVLWVQRSAEYRANAVSIYRAAAARLDQALADAGWDALAPAERAEAGPATGLLPAVSVDIDGTELDNWPYQARLVAKGGVFGEATLAQWVEERQARPVSGALEFACAAHARGVTRVYLFNRAAH